MSQQHVKKNNGTEEESTQPIKRWKMLILLPFIILLSISQDFNYLIERAKNSYKIDKCSTIYTMKDIPWSTFSLLVIFIRKVTYKINSFLFIVFIPALLLHTTYYVLTISYFTVLSITSYVIFTMIFYSFYSNIFPKNFQLGKQRICP
uniref:Transmembrane protein n=1 Tax=Heterorhabditis bacteriophora TaxID=37862 RepID=A0A1I7XRR8_HETBA